MTIFGIIKELCKDALGILFIAICIRTAYEMLIGLKRALFPDPIDTTKPIRYRTKPTYATAFQDRKTGDWTVTEDGRLSPFTVKRDFFHLYYERVEDDE